MTRLKQRLGMTCLAAVPALMLVLLIASPVARGFPLTNCTLSLVSKDANGATIGSALGGADDGTASHPLEVDWDGTVSYEGTTGGQTIRNYSYHVEVFGIPTPLNSGGVHGNDAGTTSSSSTLSVSENIPFQIVGLYYVSGAISGDGGSCQGSGWIKLRGDPVGTIPFGAAIVLALMGIVATAASLPGRHPIRGLIGGLLAGLGAALGTVVLSEMPLDSNTPLAALLAVTLVFTTLGFVNVGGTTGSTVSSAEGPPAPEVADGSDVSDTSDHDLRRVCDELAGRFRTMGQSRQRLLRGLQQGMSGLGQAYDAERRAAAARDDLSRQHTQAIALLGASIGTAGAAAVGLLGGCAAAASAAGDALSSAYAWVAGGSEAVLDFIPVMAGGAEPEIGLGANMVKAAASRAAQNYALAGDLAHGAAAAGGAAAGTVARIEQLMSSAMQDVDAAMARAVSMRQELEAACRNRMRELNELDAEIGAALQRLATCPGVDPAQLQDPRTPLPSWPQSPGQPPRG